MGMLRIDWNVIATIVNIIVLYFLMKKFLFGPIERIVEQRRTMIEQKFTNVRDEKSKAEQMRVKYQDLMRGAKEESQEIIERAKKVAQKEYDSKMDSANQQVTKMLDSARERIEVEREKMFHDLESQIASLAMTAAGKVLGETEPAKKKTITQQFIKELGDNHDTTRS